MNESLLLETRKEIQPNEQPIQAIGRFVSVDLAFKQQQQIPNQSIRMHLPYWFSFVKLLFYKFAYFIRLFLVYLSRLYRNVAISAIVPRPFDK